MSTAAKARARKPAVRAGKVLVLRTCNAQGGSHGGFRWPKKGPVSAPDWSPEPRCGFGLHGLLWGEGDGSLLNWSQDARWLVVEVAAKDVVDLGGKVKFPRGRVLVCGTADIAVKYLQERAPAGKAIVSGTATAGVGGTATAGYRGTATAGDSGTATAGVSGTATAGDRGTATAGDSGAATAGYRGTATAGDGGTATAGVGGTARSGDLGVIAIEWYDAARGRYRKAIGYVGEDGIKPNTPYIVVDGKLTEKEAAK